MVDSGKSDKMIKISVKGDNSNAYNGFSGDISFFIYIRGDWFIHFPISFHHSIYIYICVCVCVCAKFLEDFPWCSS